MSASPHSGDENREPGLLAKIAATLVMSLVVLCVALQVLNRYVAHIQVSWTEELSRLLLVWVASIGAIIAVGTRSHFRMEILTGLLPPGARWALAMLVSAATIVFLGFLTYSGVLVCLDQADSRSPMLGISYAVPMVALPILASGMIVATLARALYGERHRESDAR